MGVGLFPTEPTDRMRQLVHRAEELGYDNVWVGDSQNIWRESSVTMAAAAVGTARVVLGTGVTNPVTRHRSALASAWASLHELTGGRVAMGIGVGDSSMFTMGLKPARLAYLERTVGELRALWRGEETVEEGTGAAYRLAYVDEPLHVPVYLGASGPKILHLAGRIADGVIVLVGTDPRFIRAGLASIAAGAAESGRTLADLHLVLWTPTAIDPDPTAARDLVRAHVARVSMRPLPAAVDPEQRAAIERIRAAYDYYEHMDVNAAHSTLVPDSLVDMFALAGAPGECEQRIREIKDLGIDQISIIPYVGPNGDRATTMASFAEIVARI
jgi:5,10-methylenetetrahydromethanopterin reductase